MVLSNYNCLLLSITLVLISIVNSLQINHNQFLLQELTENNQPLIFESQENSDKEVCKQYEYKYPKSFKKDNSTVLNILYNETFRNQSAKKLSGAVKIETQVYDNSPTVEDDPNFWNKKFNPLYNYLNKTFPIIFQNLEIELINQHGLLITWKGSNPNLKSIGLLGHLDVVPIQSSTLNQWTYPPFSGHYDGEKLWGRGSSDCKNLVIGLLETIEELYKFGFKPKRNIILGFGFDEEIGGFRGAKNIANHLIKKYGKDSFYAIYDEGGQSIAYENDVLLALPGTGEKGSIDIKISLNTPGGHSSVPPKHTSIGLISKFITLLESNPFEPIFTPLNPTYHEYQCIAKYSPTIPKEIKWSILNAQYPNANKIARDWIYNNQSLTSKYLISSTQAIDIINGGVKSNALPEYVEIIMNHRIAIEQTVEEIFNHDLVFLKQIADEYNLGLIITNDNETIIEPTSNGYFKIEKLGGLEPAPTTPTTGKKWELLVGNIRHVYEKLSFTSKSPYYNQKVIVSGGIATGNTDTRWYWDLTRDIYRYRPGLLTSVESHAHGVDEHIIFDSHLQIIAFYFEYLQLINEQDSED
ncbi:uncharacterized protein KGF55_002982 [Candida pseudojiufengensis]|uniref:uncharacterized protein n=1 Tax=Candida pseudojiufengensis TaxID=497109 RepID=UPI002225678A|nr:uncharacterized protein KGF55_002982 [Candida pseudojiufengensis]KAI5963190.1 hypothetical protein KGF55_002982 [Candida pseudojiufengensis]